MVLSPSEATTGDAVCALAMASHAFWVGDGGPAQAVLKRIAAINVKPKSLMLKAHPA